MSRTLSPVGLLTILSGAVLSNAIAGFEKSQHFGLYAPATLTGTITIEVCPTDTGTDFYTLRSGGTAINPAAGFCDEIMAVDFAQLRLRSTLAEGAERVFKVVMRHPA